MRFKEWIMEPVYAIKDALMWCVCVLGALFIAVFGLRAIPWVFGWFEKKDE